jgi:hypothetical protein
MKTEIEQRFEASAEMLPEIRGRFTAQVVRWVYSLADIWSYEDRGHKGSDTDILSGPEGAFHACGFDALGQPIVLLHFVTPKPSMAGRERQNQLFGRFRPKPFGARNTSHTKEIRWMSLELSETSWIGFRG